MTPGKDVTPVTTSTALSAEDQEALRALQAQQDSEIGDDLLTTPILKIAQPLTKEVQAEDSEIEPGEFVNTLTGESLGNVVEFIPAYYQKGRFAVDRESNRSFVAFGALIPDAWGDLVGEEFVGQPFDEHPDAEETYKARVNRKEIQWGHGPLISTTHNFTGLALVGEDPEDLEMQPVRLSLQRTNVPIVRKWLTLIKSKRNTMMFDYLYTLGTTLTKFDRGSAFLLTVKQTRPTTDDEKVAAIELAQAVAAGRTKDNQAKAAEGETPVEPDAAGGAAI